MVKISLFAICLGAIALVASAHMGLTPETAVAGERTIVTLRVGHDCGDDTIGTTNFTVKLPPRLPSVSVEQTGQWRTIIHKAVADPPIDSGHGLVDEYVSAVTYLGFLPDGYYQLFNIRIKIPDTPGEELWFEGYQDCHNQGTSIAWDMKPTEDNPKPRYPARKITIVEPEEEESA